MVKDLPSIRVALGSLASVALASAVLFVAMVTQHSAFAKHDVSFLCAHAQSNNSRVHQFAEADQTDVVLQPHNAYTAHPRTLIPFQTTTKLCNFSNNCPFW